MVYSLVSLYFNNAKIKDVKELSSLISLLKLTCNKKELYKTLVYKTFRDLLSSKFLEKGLGTVSPPHFVYDFLTKLFLMLYSFN